MNEEADQRRRWLLRRIRILAEMGWRGWRAQAPAPEQTEMARFIAFSAIVPPTYVEYYASGEYGFVWADNAHIEPFWGGLYMMVRQDGSLYGGRWW